MKNKRLAGATGSWWAAIFLAMALPLSAQTNLSNASPLQLKKLSLEDLMNLDVTSVSKRPEPYWRAPAAIQVITQDDIRRSGASSIPEALRLADNLQVAQVNAQQWAITARGFNGNYANKLLVMIDGRSVYTPLYSGVFWDVQDYLMEDIDRIEVISGPGATLWGANAVNGVINIMSKSAKDTQGFLLEAGGGTEMRGFGGLRYGGVLATNVYYRVYGKFFDRDSAVLRNGADANNGWRKGQGGFRIDWEASPQNTVTVQGDIYDGSLDQAPGGHSQITGGNLLTRWTHNFTEDSAFSLQMYYDRTDRTRITGLNLSEYLDTYDLDAQYRLQAGERNNLVMGLGYRFTHDKIQNSPTLAFLPPVLDRNLFSAFIQDEIKLFDNLTFTPGTKLEHNDYTEWEFQPSGRLSWGVTSNQTIWAAVSRAVRTPSRFDADQFRPATPPYTIAGGPNFISETVNAYELGYRVRPHPNVTLTASTFYNNYDHLRTRSVPPPAPSIIGNNMNGQTYGAELNGSWQVSEELRLKAGYTLLKEELSVFPGFTDASHTLLETQDPQQQFSVGAAIDLPHQWEFDTRLRWVDTLKNFSGGQFGSVPAYFELDARLGWRVNDHLELTLVGQNLLHDQHPEYSFPSATRSEIERGFYGKAVWRF